MTPERKESDFSLSSSINSFSQIGTHLWMRVATGMICANWLGPGPPEPRGKGLSWFVQTHQPPHHPLLAQAKKRVRPKLYGCYTQREGGVDIVETTSRSTTVYTSNLVTMLAEGIYNSCVGSLSSRAALSTLLLAKTLFLIKLRLLWALSLIRPQPWPMRSEDPQHKEFHTTPHTIRLEQTLA